jgi:hypothetical protein
VSAFLERRAPRFPMRVSRDLPADFRAWMAERDARDGTAS